MTCTGERRFAWRVTNSVDQVQDDREQQPFDFRSIDPLFGLPA